MRAADPRWQARIERLSRPAWERWIHPPGERIRVGAAFRVWVALAHVHRWLWLRGVEL